ncbi:UDP-N-acetylmuramate--L-alanine ligase [Geosporobacter ferrireducens]|uniref:UDP-N-acetylmuramate--L-alanine ligase n=1 Tax=Geosporobacter ferrireducens TaxID=1424294 RepID=UPI00139E8FE8|nr:UDP-N-acetylmuramate--L-alanine ligase [Geosporobacter ferrireducens]MTI58277.1 UDP-N-acetylmuramate--L-alanine ligase [Geosporobacter ferrireducens]
MVNFDLNAHHIQHIHFIGIGGISMSAIAEMLLSFDYKVSGSDLKASKITNRLQAKGADVIIGHSPQNIQACDLVVYTAAVKEDNPELAKARQTGIPVIDRAEMLGLLMKKFDTSIAVAGTHGKTTTTSMISLILEHAGFDPTILVGGELDEIGGNIKIGKDQYLVTEACEYVESFLKFFPKIGIILNIDADHLDYFKDMDHILEAFSKFAQRIPSDGFLIACKDDLHTEALIEKVDCPVVTYGIKKEADYQAKNIQFNHQGFPMFDLFYKGEFLAAFQLSVPGHHNISNSLAAIACCHILGVPLDRMQEKLNRFRGTHRRFEKLGEINGLTVIDDYAHHPTEIKATLQAATQYPHHSLWCIFQPHTYTRTITLLEDFAEAFKDADQVIIADIYAAREKDTGMIHARDLASAIEKHQENITYIGGFEEITRYILTHAQSGDLIITMGAGDIYQVGEMLLGKI